MALDANSAVWNFESQERLYRLVSPLLDCSSPETTPIQIQCETLFSAVLTRSGDVYVWSMYAEGMTKYRNKYRRVAVPDGGTDIPCHTWEINVDPTKLPSLPDLPDLPMTGLPEEERRKETKLIQIAACSNSLVGLTNKGHVLQVGRLYGGEGLTWFWDYVSEGSRMIWHPFSNRDM